MEHCYVWRNGSSDWPRFVEVTIGASDENGFKETTGPKGLDVSCRFERTLPRASSSASFRVSPP